MPHTPKGNRRNIFWINFAHQLPSTLANGLPPIVRVLFAHAIISIESLIGSDDAIHHLSIFLKQSDFIAARSKIVRK